MSNDWSECVDKVAAVLFDRIRLDKCDIPVDAVRERAIESLSKVVPSGTGFPLITPEGEVDIDMSSLVHVIDTINTAHRERAVELLGRIGEVVDEVPAAAANPNPDARLAGEDGGSVYLRVNGSTVRIGKDTALKIATLGYIP